MRTDKLRAMFEKKQLFIGTHCQIAEPIATEIMAMQGFEFVWIDTEHSAIDRKDLNMMILAAHASDAAVLVRVTDNDPAIVKPILEMGPDGIIFPNVRNVEEAERAVASVRYPPVGVRGYGPQRATGYGRISNDEWVERESKKVWCIPQIEDYRAVEIQEKIMAVPGVDAMMCGPNDLSGSMGKLTKVADPEVAKYLDLYVSKANAAGIPCGTSFGYGKGGDAMIETWLRRGVDFICVGGDINYLASGAAQMYRNIKGIKEKLK